MQPSGHTGLCVKERESERRKEVFDVSRVRENEREERGGGKSQMRVRRYFFINRSTYTIILSHNWKRTELWKVVNEPTVKSENNECIVDG